MAADLFRTTAPFFLGSLQSLTDWVDVVWSTCSSLDYFDQASSNREWSTSLNGTNTPISP